MESKNIIDAIRGAYAGSTLYKDVTTFDPFGRYKANKSSKSLVLKGDDSVPSNQPAHLLTEEYERVDNIPGFKTLLYTHQKTSIQAMHRMEQERTIEIAGDDNYRVTYSAGILSNPVGSGKTIIILGLCALRQPPKPIPAITHLPLIQDASFGGIIQIAYKKLLKPSLIIVGRSVVNQWVKAVEVFTDLSVFVVINKRTLITLMQMIEDGQIQKYDLVIVTHMTIANRVGLALPTLYIGAPHIGKEKPTTTEILGDLRTHCWTRVIFDDYDVLRIYPYMDINGLFSWFVSSTRHVWAQMLKQESIKMKPDELTFYGAKTLHSVLSNEFIFKYMNVRCSKDFIVESTHLPRIRFYSVEIKTNESSLMTILQTIGNDHVNKIVGMLTADAYYSAAQEAGIVSNSVADIFSKILGDHYNIYRHAGDLLLFIEYINENWDKLPPCPEGMSRMVHEANGYAYDMYKYTKRDLTMFREVNFAFANLPQMLKDAKVEYEKILQETGGQIKRVKESLFHGKCSICLRDYSTVPGIVINTCCCSTLCEACGFIAQGMASRANRLLNTCSNCRALISLNRMIYMKYDSNTISDIQNEVITDDNAEEAAAEIKNSQTPPVKLTNKFTTIASIILGQEVPCKRINLTFPNIIEGHLAMRDVPQRKALVFASFDETLDKVIDVLNENKVHYWRLSGTSNEISAAVEQFSTWSNGNCALVIQSMSYCAGLNLQAATDLIFTHCVQSIDVENQILGRGHRLGRTTELRVWYIIYDTEADWFKNTRKATPFTEQDAVAEEYAGADKLFINMIFDDQVAALGRKNEFNAPDADEYTEDE